MRADRWTVRTSKWRGNPRWRLLFSIGLHLLVIGWLIHVRPIRMVPVRLPGTATGTRMLLTYSPGGAPAQSRSMLKDPRHAVVKAAPKLKVETAKREPVVAATPSPASANPDATSGNDALGTGDVNIALLSFFPVPKPDLTQLPHGTRGDVVIDVVIDASGKIVQLKMAKGLGYGVDESVLATVQQWTFHPATRNGIPVPSEQELLFHYEHS
jgi:protein TonB